MVRSADVDVSIYAGMVHMYIKRITEGVVHSENLLTVMIVHDGTVGRVVKEALSTGRVYIIVAGEDQAGSAVGTARAVRAN
jgi:hypothetical protein